jgi:hypothetical protein
VNQCLFRHVWIAEPDGRRIQGRLRTSPDCGFALSSAIYKALAASALSGRAAALRVVPQFHLATGRAGIERVRSSNGSRTRWGPDRAPPGTWPELPECPRIFQVVFLRYSEQTRQSPLRRPDRFAVVVQSVASKTWVPSRTWRFEICACLVHRMPSFKANGSAFSRTTMGHDFGERGMTMFTEIRLHLGLARTNLFET